MEFCTEIVPWVLRVRARCVKEKHWMSRHLPLPVVLILLAGIVAVLLVLLPARDARMAESTASSSEEQAQQVTNVGETTQAAVTSLANGFQDRLAADAPGATALAFLPDGRMLVSDRSGRVLVRQPGETSTTQALDIRTSVCSNSERGLLGIAVDPNFEANGYVYLYYTYKKYGVCPEKDPQQSNNPVNRVARFRMTGDTIAPDPSPDPTPDDGPGEILISNIPSPNGNHNAGDLHFGKDGKLYVSTGDGACNYAAPTRCQPENSASRDRNVLLGKILRINTDGTIPADNPYANASNGVRCGTLTNNNARGGSAAPSGTLCKETYAWGFRNPFRFAMNPDAQQTSLRVNDVGGGYIEEISIAEKGDDHGWNCFEGRRTNSNTGKCRPLPSSVKPIHQYSHNTGCSSITGGAFVPNDAGWPLSHRDAYLFGDYVCGRIFTLRPKAGGGYSRTALATNLQGGPVSLAFGTDGALYYTTYAGGGQVRRIAFVDNKAPVANARTTPADPETGETFGPTPLSANFDASGSSDPENDALTYEWDFGDQTSANNMAGGSTAAHTYESAGPYTTTLTVTDARGNTDTARATVYAGNDGPPQPVIDSITAGGTPTNTFEVNQQISLQGSAGPDADGPVALRWNIVRHHTAPNTHEHAYLEFNAPDASFEVPGPEDLRSTNPDGNYLEIRLTATDSQGLSRTVSRDLRPETTGLRFATAPKGFFVIVNGEKVRAPRTLLSWERSDLNVYAPPQTHDGKRYIFRNWSDGKTSRHTIETPEDSTSYTARFKRK
jgi:glucose/arabinose dehydrogenase